MPTFPIHQIPYIRRYEDRVRAARAIASSTTGDTAEPMPRSHTAADNLTLRGIPAVGRGVSGHIAGTQPESVATR